MKKLKKLTLLVTFLSIFPILSLKVSADTTTVNGENEGQMRVVGDLSPETSSEPEETSEPKEEVKSEETKPSESNYTQVTGSLPKTGETKNTLWVPILGLILTFGAFSIIKIKKEKS